MKILLINNILVLVRTVEEYIKEIRVKGTWMGTADCKFLAEYLNQKITFLDYSSPLNGSLKFVARIYGQEYKGCRMFRYSCFVLKKTCKIFPSDV